MNLILYFTLEFNSLLYLHGERDKKKNETKRDETVKTKKRDKIVTT